MEAVLLGVWRQYIPLCSLGIDLAGVKGGASALAWRAGFRCSLWQRGSDGGLDLEIFSVEGADAADVEAAQPLPTEAVLLRVG